MDLEAQTPKALVKCENASYEEPDFSLVNPLLKEYLKEEAPAILATKIDEA